MTLKIYGVPRSRAVLVIWMAKELGLKFDLVEMAAGSEGSRRPENLKLNPNGKIPFIDDNGLVLWESFAINLYLAKKAGSPLGPGNLKEDGLMAMWTLWATNELEPLAITVLEHTSMLPQQQRKESVICSAMQSLQGPLGVLEGALVGGEGYLVGGRFTVADLNTISCIFYLRFVSGALDGFPAVRRWYEEGMVRPANRAAYAMRGD